MAVDAGHGSALAAVCDFPLSSAGGLQAESIPSAAHACHPSLSYVGRHPLNRCKPSTATLVCWLLVPILVQ
jgi:hypothetical protein